MKTQILATATLFAVFSGVLSAADPRLLNLVMPDATVLAGVNVDQAKATPFGQYVLTTLLGSRPSSYSSWRRLTGFDPRRDVNELLLASSSAPATRTGLAMRAASSTPPRSRPRPSRPGLAPKRMGGVSIIEDLQHQNGFAFLDSTLVVAGDLANVKAAIDRRSGGPTIPAALAARVEPVELRRGRMGHLDRAAVHAETTGSGPAGWGDQRAERPAEDRIGQRRREVRLHGWW